MESYRKCSICPRECCVDRSVTKGYCSCSEELSVAKVMLHKWEEPSISGNKGSGAVFFSGCSLKCVYCQNKAISRHEGTKKYTERELADIFLELQESGAHNINLVTPSHYVLNIVKALDIAKPKLNIPVVYNTGGYEKKETIKLLEGYVDIYLPDLKYYSNDLSTRYSSAPDYFYYAKEAITEMYRQTGDYTENEEGIAQKGVIVRHLVLPGCRNDSIKLLCELHSFLPINKIRLSLMSQFTPDYVSDDYPELKRKLTTFEYSSVLKKAEELGFLGFFQQRESADKKYTPDF